ncbi:MAG: CAP domain-containing protein [Terriglobales bacterium]
MLGVFVFSLAMLVVNPAPGAAKAAPAAADVSPNTSRKLPNPPTDSANGASPGEDSAAENELLEAANKSRKLAGVEPLRMEESLREAARAHARRMVESARLEHQLAGEPSLLQRIAWVSSLRIDRAGENIAFASGAPGANEVLMRSAPHRKNLLDGKFNIAGIAAIWSKGKLYVVQDFAREVGSYSAGESGQRVGRAVDEMRQQAGLPALVQLSPPNLNQAACSLAEEGRPNARLLATAYTNRKIVTYTESRPEALPEAALRLLRDPDIHQFAVGSCYARNAAYPTGIYWVAILLY